MEHTKTTEDAILGLIRKVSELQKSLVKYTKQHFLNATQEAALHQADLSYYVYCLPSIQRRKLIESCSYTIPCKYMPVKHGRFVVIDGVVTFYNAEEHGSGYERMELDGDLLRAVLRKIKKERGKEFWEGLPGDASPQNLIDDLDIKLTPHLSLIKETSGFDIRQAITGQSCDNVDIGILTKASHELLRVLEVVRLANKEDAGLSESELELPESANGKPADTTGQNKQLKKICKHSENYQFITWCNELYTFNKNQSKAIRLLWEAWESNSVGVPEKTIAKVIDTSSENYKLRDTFRSHGKYHPAWNKIIHHVGNGVYKLIMPDN